MKIQQLLEGGNIFKAPDYTREQPHMLTRNIRREEVPETVKYLEELLGIPLAENLLGSTGVAPESGDMDIAIDANKVSKDDVYNYLVAAVDDPAYVKKSGDSVHFMTPIMGDADKGFVQTDLMMTPNVRFAVWSMEQPKNSAYKGRHKQQLMADLVRTVNPNWKWNHFKGIIDRTTNESVCGYNPKAIAQAVLGDTATPQDLNSVESILAKLKSNKNEQAVKDNFRATLARDEGGPQLNEAANPKVGREFQHLEDLVYTEGVAGVKRAVQRLLAIAKNSGELEVKWDGSPAIIFGRDESGKFHFGDKFAKQLLSTPEEVYAYYTRTSQTEGRREFANSMAKLTKLYEAATPRDYRGFLEGGLLWREKLEEHNGEYSFEPNTVRYFVKANTELGRRVGNSITGCAATAYFDNLPALGGQRRPVGDMYKPLNSISQVVVIPPKFAEGKAKLDVEEIKSLFNYAAANKTALESFIAAEPGFSDMKNIIYTYVNSQVDSPTLLADLGKNFAEWVQQSGKVSQPKQAKILQRLETNGKGAQVLFEIVRAIMIIKDDLVDAVESDTLGSLGMRAELGKFGQGGEGFVHDPDAGVGPTKLVKRGQFTAANRAKSRGEEPVAEAITRRGFLKGLAGAGLAGAAGKASAIAGAIPTPSHQQAMYKAMADSNAAEARRQAELQRQANAARAAKLDAATKDVDRLNKINFHGGKVTPANASWDGDSDFLDLDGTQYAMASRMPIRGDEPGNMKLISTKEGRLVYIWTRNSLKGVVGRYFYPAPAGSSQINEYAPTRAGGAGDDYLKTLASAWFNDTYNTGSLNKGIETQEDIERILERGIICNDGKKRKYSIGYNSGFDGVVITSDDWYEYSDQDDNGRYFDERTGKPWGPYEYIEFKGNQLYEQQVNNVKPLAESIQRTGQSDTAVVGWGRGMGHKGHMYLASSVITTAKELGGDAYFVLSRTVGADDPLEPQEKLQIYKKVFPQHKKIFQTATDEMPDLTRVLSMLDSLGYKRVVVIVGEDQKRAFQYLNNYNGKPNKKGEIPFQFDELNVISRQETNDPFANEEGPRATPMREILMNPEATSDDKFRVWRDAMPDKLSNVEVRSLMKRAASRLGSPVKEAEDPRFAGGNSISAIPGTPPDLQFPSKEEIKRKKREHTEAELLRKWMGHTND